MNPPATVKKPLEEIRKDIFDTILSTDLPVNEKQPKRIADKVYNLLVACSLTTLKTAVIAFCHVLGNPKTYQRFRKELSEAISNKNVVPGVKTLQKLPVLVGMIYLS